MTRNTWPAPPAWGLLLVGALTLVALVLQAPGQLFDTNFYSLWEATALLVGDHPYRDFFEWGVPLQALLSALVQLLVGYRMWGEFVLIHWTFIVAGALVSFAVGYRVTGSPLVSLVMASVATAVLPVATFHYPKFFFYPLAIWLCWRYMDRPSTPGAIALGVATAIAFLFRHDHGVYLGGASVLALGLAWHGAHHTLADVPWRRHVAAYSVAVSVFVLPWMAVVQLNEGLGPFLQSRGHLYRLWSAPSPRQVLASFNLLAALPARLYDRQAGVVEIAWAEGMSEPSRIEIEHRFGLISAGTSPVPEGGWRYRVADVYGPHLSELRAHVRRSDGLDWDRIAARRSWLPEPAPALLWLAGAIVIVPWLLLAATLPDYIRAWRRRVAPPAESSRLLLAGAFLAVVDARLVREPSYALLVAPLTAAMAGRFLRSPIRDKGSPGMAWQVWLHRGVAGLALAFSVLAALGVLQPARFGGRAHWQDVSATFERMFQPFPIDSVITRVEALTQLERLAPEASSQAPTQLTAEILLRYLHDCTRGGDRVLVSGSTPYQVGYLVRRAIAGGHLFWHHGWRSDPAREQQSLSLLQSQSVPFAYSTNEQMLDEVRSYPAIREYLRTNYRPLPGSDGRLLVDQRRRPTGAYGPLAFPCFS